MAEHPTSEHDVSGGASREPVDLNDASPEPVDLNDVVAEATPCRRCGKDLQGLRPSDACGGCGMAVVESLAAPSIEEAFCIQCGYQLRGLQREGACPECGTPVERSLRGNQLQHSSLRYVQSLRRGAWLVLAVIIVQILAVVGMLVVTVVAAAGGAGVGMLSNVELIAQGVATLLELISLYGWWLLSELDPAYAGRDQGTTARKVIRWALVIGAIYNAFELLFYFIPGAQTDPTMVLIGASIGVVAMIVWAVQFFASMLYIRWLAPRLPNQKVYARAKVLMWLGPLLVTVGTLCVGLGPLIALVMYWNMIYWMYGDLKRIEGEIALQEPAR